MDLITFKNKISDLNNRLDKYYREFETNDRKWIKDGLVNDDAYFYSPVKILWVLKEPRVEVGNCILFTHHPCYISRRGEKSEFVNDIVKDVKKWKYR